MSTSPMSLPETSTIGVCTNERPPQSFVSYGEVVPVPFTSNGAVASDCSLLPSSSRKATGVVWSLPPKNVESPVIEYMPAPDLIPSPLALVVSVIVQGPAGGVAATHVPPTVAACVWWYSSEVIVGFVLSNLPASPTGAPLGGLSR